MILLLSLLLCQDGLAGRIERLGSDDLDTREAAAREILETGAAALPELRRHADDADATRRAHVRELISKIEWLATWERDFAKDLAKEERAFLEQAGLLAALETPRPKDWKPEKTDLPAERKIWGFVRKAILDKAEVVKGAEADTFIARNGDWFVAEVRVAGTSQFMRGKALAYIVMPRSARFDPAKASWAGGSIAGLGGAWDKPRTDLYLDGAGKGLDCSRRFAGGAYFGFHWDQDKPFANLRHAFVKERWALLVIDHQ